MRIPRKLCLRTGCRLRGCQPESHELHWRGRTELPGLLRVPGDGQGQAGAARRLALPDRLPGRVKRPPRGWPQRMRQYLPAGTLRSDAPAETALRGRSARRWVTLMPGILLGCHPQFCLRGMSWEIDKRNPQSALSRHCGMSSGPDIYWDLLESGQDHMQQSWQSVRHLEAAMQPPVSAPTGCAGLGILGLSQLPNFVIIRSDCLFQI